MDETFEERLAAVERALTDGDHDCAALAEGAATADRIRELESDIEDLTDRVAELEAATQALRGYVGNVRSVNNEVEARAETALSKAEAAHRIATDDARDGDERPGHPTDAGSRTAPSSGQAARHPGAAERCDRCQAPLDAGRERTPLSQRHDGSGTHDRDRPHSGEQEWRRTGDGSLDGDGPERRGAPETTSGESRLADLGDTGIGVDPQQSAGFGSTETDGGREERGSEGESDASLLALIRDAV